jgi:hypothetical protein
VALVEGPLHEARTPEQRARAERFLPVAYGIARYLVGDRYADALGYPKTPWRFAAPALRTLISSTGRLVGRLPGVDRLAVEAGLRYWQRAATVGLAGEDARFELPSRMRHA